MLKWDPSSVHSSKYFIVVIGKERWERGVCAPVGCFLTCTCWHGTASLWNDSNTRYTTGGSRRNKILKDEIMILLLLMKILTSYQQYKLYIWFSGTVGKEIWEKVSSDDLVVAYCISSNVLDFLKMQIQVTCSHKLLILSFLYFLKLSSEFVYATTEL